MASKCGPKTSEDTSHVLKTFFDIRQSTCFQMEAILFFSIVFQVLERTRNSSTLSCSLPVPRIAVLGFILYKSRILFIRKIRILKFCATYCISRWSKCDHVLYANFRNTSVSFADGSRKLNHASSRNIFIQH